VPVVDGAIAAKGRRLILSEIGINMRKGDWLLLVMFLEQKIKVVDYHIELANMHEWFTWTGISTAFFG
jgi:hypothetical protein